MILDLLKQCNVSGVAFSGLLKKFEERFGKNPALTDEECSQILKFCKKYDKLKDNERYNGLRLLKYTDRNPHFLAKHYYRDIWLIIGKTVLTESAYIAKAGRTLLQRFTQSLVDFNDQYPQFLLLAVQCFAELELLEQNYIVDNEDRLKPSDLTGAEGCYPRACQTEDRQLRRVRLAIESIFTKPVIQTYINKNRHRNFGRVTSCYEDKHPLPLIPLRYFGVKSEQDKLLKRPIKCSKCGLLLKKVASVFKYTKKNFCKECRVAKLMKQELYENPTAAYRRIRRQSDVLLLFIEIVIDAYILNRNLEDFAQLQAEVIESLKQLAQELYLQLFSKSEQRSLEETYNTSAIHSVLSRNLGLVDLDMIWGGE